MKLILAGLVLVFGNSAILLAFADEPPSTAPTEEWVSEVVAIKYEMAADVAAALNSLTTHYRGLGTNPLVFRRDAEKILSNAWTNLSQQFKEINRPPAGRIIADERTNALLIFAPTDDLKILKETIARLDTAREEILIEAVVFEVTLDGTNSAETICFGGSESELNPLTSYGESGPSKVFAPVGGTDTDFHAMIARLTEHKAVKILQRPRIQTADGVAASLFIGATGPYSRIDQDESDRRAEESRYSMNEVLGVTLDVSPTITRERKLRMNIAQTIDKYAGITNIANFKEPITRRQKLQAELTVADGQTIVVAGPVEQAQDKPPKGVPVLKDTPLIGGLFRNHPRKMQVQTLMAIRATILPEKVARTSK
jgi:general secretion pathway protein D